MELTLEEKKKFQVFQYRVVKTIPFDDCSHFKIGDILEGRTSIFIAGGGEVCDDGNSVELLMTSIEGEASYIDMTLSEVEIEKERKKKGLLIPTRYLELIMEY